MEGDCESITPFYDLKSTSPGWSRWSVGIFPKNVIEYEGSVGRCCDGRRRCKSVRGLGGERSFTYINRWVDRNRCQRECRIVVCRGFADNFSYQSALAERVRGYLDLYDLERFKVCVCDVRL